MLLREPTPEMVKNWKSSFDENKDKLRPNKKTAAELIDYLAAKYPLEELNDPRARQIVIENVTRNEYSAQKLRGRTPRARAFCVQETGLGRRLYEAQDEVFEGCAILVGIELETAYFMVEGSSMLWDELLAYCGLDEDDLKNFYLVAEYIECMQKQGR